MKRSIFLAVMCALFIICSAQENIINKPVKKNPAVSEVETIIFDKTEHDFGVISQSGGVKECEFSFKNTGSSPVVISKVTASCGCTATDYSKEPIAPGKQGFIKAKFNPNSTKGEFSKLITVLSNGNPSRISLRIKGEVN